MLLLVGWASLIFKLIVVGIITLQQQQKRAEDIVEGDDSMDVLELIALEAMYKFLLGNSSFRCCPLYGMMCSESPIAKSECFDTPWLGTPCAFTVVSLPLELIRKMFIGKIIFKSCFHTSFLFL